MVTPAEERNTPCPVGYEEVEELVHRTTELILHREAQIERLRTAKEGPPMRPIPPGLGPQPIFSPAQLIVGLEKEIIQLQEDSLRQIEQITRLDLKQGPRVRDWAVSTLFPNKYLEMNAAELEKARGQIKGLEQSQQFQHALGMHMRQAAPPPNKEQLTEFQPAEEPFLLATGDALLLEPPQADRAAPAAEDKQAPSKPKELDGPEP